MLVKQQSLKPSAVLDHSVPKATPRPRRKLSRQGLLLIKSFEGFRPRAVARRDGTLTIGYGHTLTAREGIEITEEEAELLLLHDLIPAANLLHAHVRRPLTQNQYDALISFIFSIGTDRFERSGILALIRKGDFAEVAEILASIPDRQQPPIDLPYRRRSAEKALFEMEGPASLEKILTAPVGRPGFTIPPPLDAPLGVTGVVRHEPIAPLTTAQKKANRRLARSQEASSVALLAAVAVVVGLAGYMAYTHGQSLPMLRSHGLMIGGAMVGLAAIIISSAIWLLTRAPRKA